MISTHPLCRAHYHPSQKCIMQPSRSSSSSSSTCPNSGSATSSRRCTRISSTDGGRSSSSGSTSRTNEVERLDQAIAQAFTMSQLYAQDRPAAIPQAEWELRRKKRDMAEILDAAKRRGKDLAAVSSNLEQLESILPNLVDLNKMKAADWVTLSEDVAGAANKLVLMKTAYPSADMTSIMAMRPRTLLQPEQQIREHAAQVKNMLGSADVDAIIQAVPELMDPATLSRSLAFLKSSFPEKDPVALLQDNPRLLLNLGESNVEDSAEYGEICCER